MKGVMRFGKKGKLSPWCIGPYRISKRVDSRSPSSQVEDKRGSINNVLSRNQFVEEATWEAKEDMKKRYPHLFETGETPDQVYPSLVSSMSEQMPLLSLKKTVFHSFFPSKVEEEACIVNNTPYVVTRELVEIRDLYPAPRIDMQNPWQIKKKITHDEIVVGMLMIPFFEVFE
ncbi:hypothetical protein MTR67_024325 [Solanum verrucosum]|uniref:Uncharacterized protein n=1 Tax=Solanum verrucosum TaxID=315347 RepID=A0AAF0TYD5_SOLVR|nr:hypothetical protein MTR67_024325 [Solanum verrucosum]